MAKQQPFHIVYVVKRISQTGEKGKGGFWTKIGAAWLHKDTKGLDIVVELIPVVEPRLDDNAHERHALEKFRQSRFALLGIAPSAPSGRLPRHRVGTATGHAGDSSGINKIAKHQTGLALSAANPAPRLNLQIRIMA